MKIIITLLLLSSLVSCDQARGHSNIRAKHPHSDIAKALGSGSYTWIVRDPDGSVWFCRNDGFGDVVQETILFPTSQTAEH